MTGLEFKNYVIRKFKRTDKDTELYEATTDIIADMRIQFNSEDFKEEAYSSGISTLGEYKLGLPTDFGHIIGDITITDTANDGVDRVLGKISKQEYDLLFSDRLTDAPNKAQPHSFCIYGKQIFVGPVPDLTTYRYQFNYTTEAYTEIASDTADVAFTDKYRNVLRAGVLAELYDGMENYEESQYWRGVYMQGLSKIAVNDEKNIQDDGSVMYHGV